MLKALWAARGRCTRLLQAPRALPVRVIDYPSIDPLFQNLKVRHTGSLGEVQAQLLCLAVARVVEAPVVEKAQGGPPDTLAFIHRGGCQGGRQQSAEKGCPRLPQLGDNRPDQDLLLGTDDPSVGDTQTVSSKSLMSIYQEVLPEFSCHKLKQEAIQALASHPGVLGEKRDASSLGWGFHLHTPRPAPPRNVPARARCPPAAARWGQARTQGGQDVDGAHGWLDVEPELLEGQEALPLQLLQLRDQDQVLLY